MNYEGQSTLIMSIATIAVIIIIFLPQITNITITTAQQAIASIIILILATTTIILTRREGAIPIQLITKYLPFPLIILWPDKKIFKRIKDKVLPAVKEIITLIENNSRENTYKIMKNIYDFFYEELGFRPNDLDSNSSLLSKMKELYPETEIPVKEERTSAAFSLASLILWIFKYRNLTFHYPKKDPDPIDTWFALRTLLIYLKDKYRINKTTLYSECPKCGEINKVEINEDNAYWLKTINVKCEKCEREYKIKLTPDTIEKHYNIIRKLHLYKH